MPQKRRRHGEHARGAAVACAEEPRFRTSRGREVWRLAVKRRPLLAPELLLGNVRSVDLDNVRSMKQGVDEEGV